MVPVSPDKPLLDELRSAPFGNRAGEVIDVPDEHAHEILSAFGAVQSEARPASALAVEPHLGAL